MEEAIQWKIYIDFEFDEDAAIEKLIVDELKIREQSEIAW